jgi:hypothetical protein
MPNKFLRNPLRQGEPISRSQVADAIDKMDKAWGSLDCLGGYVDWHNGRPLIVPNGSGGGGGGTGSGFPWSKVRFGYALSAELDSSDEPTGNTLCTINKGTIRVHGSGNFECSGGEVVLNPMVTAWVFAQMSRGGGTVTIGAQSTEPVSDVVTLRVPLYQFEQSGSSYALADAGICHIGDINFDVPLL